MQAGEKFNLIDCDLNYVNVCYGGLQCATIALSIL